MRPQVLLLAAAAGLAAFVDYGTAAKGDVAAIVGLASAGADLDATDGHGRTPLMVAAYRRHHEAGGLRDAGPHPSWRGCFPPASYGGSRNALAATRRQATSTSTRAPASRSSSVPPPSFTNPMPTEAPTVWP